MLRLLRVVALLLVAAAAAGSAARSGEISRDDFPRGFVFGAGTSAYQVSLQY
jgi:beta-glucosidase